MAAMGLMEEAYRLPLVPPRPASRERIHAVLAELQLIPAGAASRR
jgi:dihydrodipicolinate synthase/N-acetylneuraminate lyase